MSSSKSSSSSSSSPVSYDFRPLPRRSSSLQPQPVLPTPSLSSHPPSRSLPLTPPSFTETRRTRSNSGGHESRNDLSIPPVPPLPLSFPLQPLLRPSTSSREHNQPAAETPITHGTGRTRTASRSRSLSHPDNDKISSTFIGSSSSSGSPRAIRKPAAISKATGARPVISGQLASEDASLKSSNVAQNFKNFRDLDVYFFGGSGIEEPEDVIDQAFSNKVLGNEPTMAQYLFMTQPQVS